MTVEFRRWRRGLAKASRRPVRAFRNVRPSPAVGALLLAAILGSGVAAGVVVAADATSPEASSSSHAFPDHQGMGFGHGWQGAPEGPWGHDGPRH